MKLNVLVRVLRDSAVAETSFRAQKSVPLKKEPVACVFYPWKCHSNHLVLNFHSSVHHRHPFRSFRHLPHSQCPHSHHSLNPRRTLNVPSCFCSHSVADYGDSEAVAEVAGNICDFSRALTADGVM